jgi:hypothetical protein
MQNLLESIDTPETRRKWGGMLKQAFATVESRFDALDLGGLAMSNVPIESNKLDRSVETDPVDFKPEKGEEDWRAAREAEQRAMSAERQLCSATTLLRGELEELARQVLYLRRQLGQAEVRIEKMKLDHEKEMEHVMAQQGEELKREKDDTEKLREKMERLAE